jgi:xylulokinase
MPSLTLLAVDLGTSAIKVAAFDILGNLLGSRRGETPTTRLPDGRAEHDVDLLWSVCAGLIADLVAVIPECRVEGVGIASVGEAGAPVDKTGRPVRPAIAWFDSRGSAEAEWWNRTVGLDRVGRITGQAIDPHFGVNRLMWIREHEPEAFSRTRRWLSLADLIIHRLCGAYVTDYSLASRTMVFDQRRLAWSDELIDLAGLDPSLFPRAVQSGTRVGAVSADAAKATGLLVGTPVVTGGHDRLCAAFAARGRAAIPVDSAGSAEAIVMPVGAYVERSPVESGFVSCYADVVPGQFVLSARVGYAGALIDWYRREVQAKRGEADHLAVDREVDWPLAFSGLLCYPSFGRVVAPEWDPATASGAILGLTLGHRQSQVIQALIEAVSYSLRANVEWLERLAGESIETIRVEGALTASRVWMQLKADVTGRRVEGLRVPEVTALGAALLAGVGAGVYSDCGAAADSVERALETWLPEPQLASVYGEVFEHGFRRLPRMIGELAPILERTTGPQTKDRASASREG